MVDPNTQIADHFIHAGAGTALVVANVGALIPGFIPVLALTAIVTVVLVAPLVIVALSTALVLTPPYAIWALATRERRHGPRPRGRRERARGAQPEPAPGLRPRGAPTLDPR